MTDRSESRLRVLSLPGRDSAGGNPYFRVLCDGLEAAGVTMVDVRSARTARLAFDVVHVHFPDHYVTEQTLVGAIKWTGVHLALFLAAKLRGRRLVWSVHDVQPFRQRHRWLLRPYMAVFRRLVDGHVFLGPSSQAAFRAAFPRDAGKPSIVVPHPPYPVVPDDPAETDRQRAMMGVTDAFTIGYLGSIKTYKNPAALAALPATLADGRQVRLIVAGAADADSREAYAAACATLPTGMVVRVDGAPDDAALDRLIRCCDLLFLPYSEGWNSGMAMLALSNRRRILGSELAIFGELRDRFGEPWVYRYGAGEALAAVLGRIAERPIADADRAALDEALAAVTAVKGGAALKAFYTALWGG